MQMQTARQHAAQLLGVQEDVASEDLKRLYRQLSKQHHPDAGGSDAAFQQLTNAVELLLTPPVVAPGATFTVGQDGQAQAQASEPEHQRAKDAVPERHGPVVWVRSRVRLRMLVQIAVSWVVMAAVLARAGLGWWSAGVSTLVGGAAFLLAIWGAFGRPEGLSWTKTQQPAQTAREQRGMEPDAPVASWDPSPQTDEIPVITDEMLRNSR